MLLVYVTSKTSKEQKLIFLNWNLEIWILLKGNG